MKQIKFLALGLLFITSTQISFAQSKTVPQKTVTSAATASQKAPVKAVLPQVEIAQQIIKGQTEFSFLGKYGIFAGVQKTKIGFFFLEPDGSYRVTVNSDENNYATGFYEYNSISKTLIWKGGLFLSNNYKGVMKKMDNGKVRILFSPSTYAEKID